MSLSRELAPSEMQTILSKIRIQIIYSISCNYTRYTKHIYWINVVFVLNKIQIIFSHHINGMKIALNKT